MAGAGVRVFVPGETLTASLVNTYLQDQVVARFSSAGARDSAFGGANQPTLEEGRVCYLDSTNELQYYSGTAWVSISAEAILSQVQAKGDLVVGSAPNTVQRIPIGSNGQALIALSTAPGGVTWGEFQVGDETILASKLGGAPAKAGFRTTFNQKSASYTLLLSDLGKMIEGTNALGTDITVTIPLDDEADFAIGDRVDILRAGAGNLTLVGKIAGGQTVVVNATPGLKLRAQWSGATVIKRGPNSWVAIGDLSA